MEPTQSLALASSLFSPLNSLTGYTNYEAMNSNTSLASRRSFNVKPISLPRKRPRFNASLTDSISATATERFSVVKKSLAELWMNNFGKVGKRLEVFE